jgi:hypothetical protein
MDASPACEHMSLKLHAAIVSAILWNVKLATASAPIEP